jgi:hypothetical protein
MAFTVPTFNLLCNVYTGPWVSKVLRIPDLPCNLAIGRRVQQEIQAFGPGAFGASSPCLLVPALTDIRDLSCVDVSDIIECPSGSGRWYGVTIVDDMAKGFSNEYRLVGLTKACNNNSDVEFAGVYWPVPIP